MKSFAVEGTVFWLMVSVILIGVSGRAPEVSAASLATAAVYLVVAYACWSLRRWGFVAAIILALFTALGSLAYGFVAELPVWQNFADSAWLLVPQYILIFLSLRAYRELGAG